MRAAALTLILVATACTEARENPVIQREDTSCGAEARLVTDVCTELDSDDSCAEVDDVCIALCDERTSCTNVGDLRVISPWAVGPDGYCVECDD